MRPPALGRDAKHVLGLYRGAVVKDARRGSRRAETAKGLSEAVVAELFDLQDPAELLALLSRRPDLEEGQAAEELRALAAMPGFGGGFAPLVDLIAGARADLAAAWARFERRRGEIERVAGELEQIVGAVESAAEREDHDTVVAMAEPAAREAEDAGLGIVAGFLHYCRGLALLRRVSADRAGDLEAATEALEDTLDLTEPGEARAQVLMHLAIVYGERVRGDRAENQERAIVLLRAALEELSASSHPELQAVIRTNLAVLLIRSDGVNRRAVLREAIEACRSALAFRSPDRDAVDWAYSQLNLGEALGELAVQEEGDLDEAVETYRRVIDEASRIREPWLVGEAHLALGRLYLRLARGGVEELIAAEELAEPEAEGERIRLLRAARGHLETAEALMRSGPERLRRGFVLNDLGEVFAQLDLKDEAIARTRESLAILRPTASPSACRDAGWRLGDLLAERGEWEEASAAFRDAVAAVELSFHGS